MTQEVKTIKISDLCLWTENPRDPVGEDIGDLEIIKKAIKNDKGKWNLPRLIEKMGEFYHLNKLPIVVFKDSKYIVFDGNCRIAILKYLQNSDWSFDLEGSLFPTSEPKELKELVEIPCNVCDEETALKIIYLDNISNNTWTPLQQSYFEHYHLGQNKNLFLILEEQTNLISNNHKELDQRFVKDEILTEENLLKLGITIDFQSEKLSTNHSEDITKNIFIELIEKIKSGEISTRNNRGDVSSIIPKEKASTESKEIKTNSFNDVKDDTSDKEERNSKQSKPRKTRRTQLINQILFGEKLTLSEGDVNNLYSILDELFNSYKNDKNILPIIGISLRLLMEIAGRKAYPDDFKDKDVVFGDFMKKIKNENILEQLEQNTLSLDKNFCDKDIQQFEAYIGKYAHGTIEYDQTNILTFSKIVGKVLKYYFSK